MRSAADELLIQQTQRTTIATTTSWITRTEQTPHQLTVMTNETNGNGAGRYERSGKEGVGRRVGPQAKPS